VERAAADEIYWGRQAVLMVVEPQSLCWLSARPCGALTGRDWCQELARLPRLRYVVSDAGSQLRRGIADLRAARVVSGGPPLRHGLDVFHLLRQGQRALRKVQGRVTRHIAEADQRQRAGDRLRRRGQSASGQRYWQARAWSRAEQALDEASAAERAWDQVRGALGWFSATGHLQGRAEATAAIAAALPALAGPSWAVVRRLLGRPETLAFLDEAHEELRRLGLSAATQQALVALEGLRRRPALLQGTSPAAAAARGLVLVRGVQLAKLEPQGPALAEAVRQALRRAWRASSLVECLNSVARMQQARHRQVNAPLLALKRLHWNCRVFRSGPRKGHSPYGLLGLQLPPGSWWDLLNTPPEQLRQALSAQRLAA
jgi:hypothetical protein